MRTDHFAYQRATKVAGFGLLLQIAIGILLLVFGMVSAPRDTPFIFASLYILPGVIIWLGLVIVFHQHKLERLESLEEDELAATRGGLTGRGDTVSVFDQSREESRVAGRRLAMMHKWFMPALSLLMVVVLTLLAVLILRHMKGVRENAVDFTMTAQRGWAVAICIFFAVASFIFSRFVAGMSKQAAWANLRGGAAYMVGNSLVLVAVAAGTIFRFFDNSNVVKAVAWAIPILMLVLAVEFTLNFILNLYRPRVPGEIPRPAFDSKVLSLFAAPDNIVRSLNEAVNYQFGFDVTSSWGYQLLLRSVAWLLALGFVALILLSMIVVVEPYQQALRLRGGAPVRDANNEVRVYRSGIMFKWPWPFETAAVYDVSRLRNLWLTAKVVQPKSVNLWTGEPPATDVELQPFLVASPVSFSVVQPGRGGIPGMPGMPSMSPTTQPGSGAPVGLDEPTKEDLAAEAVSAVYALIDAEMVLQYRIKADGGLLNYLEFSTDYIARAQQLTERERALRDIALGVVTSELSRRSIDEVLSPGRSDLTLDLVAKVQQAFDRENTGIEVIALEIPMLRPSGAAAEKFEEQSIGRQGAEEFKAKADRNVSATFSYLIGDQSKSAEVLRLIDEYDALRLADSPEAAKKRAVIEQMLVRSGGQAAQTIADAERDRWVQLMQRRAQASSVQSQLAAYRAAPNLYRQREIMHVYAQLFPTIEKYVIGIDPTRVRIDMDLRKTNPILDFAGASESEMNKK